MTAHVKRPIPLTLGAICFVVAIGTPFLPGFDRAETGLWAVLAWFLLGGFVFIWAAFRKTPEFEITNELVSIRGSHFERSNIRFARVFRAFHDGGRGRYIEIQFKKMPRLSIGWKLSKAFERFGFPEKCERGIPLTCEPRIIAPLNSTDLTDDELNRELTNSEQDIVPNP